MKNFFKKPLNFVEPCDFLKLPITNSIYQGDYKEKNRRKIWSDKYSLYYFGLDY